MWSSDDRDARGTASESPVKQPKPPHWKNITRKESDYHDN